MLPLSTKSLARFCFLKFPLPGSPSGAAPQYPAFILSQFSSLTLRQELFPYTLTLEPLGFFKGC